MDALDVLWIERAIRRLKAKYCRLADAREDEEFLELFTDDIEWSLHDESGSIVKQVRGKEEYRAWRSSTLATRLAGVGVHQVHEPEIDVLEKDFATAVWPLMDYVRSPPDGKYLGSFRGYGHFHEEYRRGPDDRWRISKVTVTRLYVEHLDETSEPGH